MEAVCSSDMSVRVTISQFTNPKEEVIWSTAAVKTGCTVLLGHICWEIVLQTVCQVGACWCKVDLWLLRT